MSPAYSVSCQLVIINNKLSHGLAVSFLQNDDSYVVLCDQSLNNVKFTGCEPLDV